MYAKYIKRIFDIVLSILAIIVLSPFLAVTAVLVRVKLGHPVIFRQERPGRDQKLFSLCKFRTMTDERDENGSLLPDAERTTRFGLLLRKTSIDELPELFNILKGDMSVIGPRPLLIEYLPYYTEKEQLRHSVRPGLTGLAQVRGRNLLGWDERFRTDVEYVGHITFLGDMKIIFLTFASIFKRSTVADDTSRVEGNFAKIRQKQLDDARDGVSTPEK